MSLQKMVKQMVETMNMPKGTEPYDTTAEVVRVDGDTVWVHIAGGVDETPVKKTIDAVKGDRVQIRVGGGTAWIVGNESKPPTDDRVANVAKKTAENADLKAILAKKTADDASKVATNYIDFTEEDGLTVGHKNLESKVNISGDGVKLYDEEGKVGTSIKSGEVNVGTEDTNAITLDQYGIRLKTKEEIDAFYIGATTTPKVIPYSEAHKKIAPTYTLQKEPVSGEIIDVTSESGSPVNYSHLFHAGTPETYNGITYDGDCTFSTETLTDNMFFFRYYINTYPPYLTFGNRTIGSGGTEYNIGDYTATLGEGLVGRGYAQTVVGRYNDASSGLFRFIVGDGGSEDGRRNILASAVPTGNLMVYGDVYVGCKSDSTGGRKLVSASTTSGSGTVENVATGATPRKNLTSIYLSDAGVYLLIGLARFETNSNGRRGLAWGTTPTGYYDHSFVVVPPASGDITRIQSMAIVTVTSTLDVYLNCYHTAGTSLDVDYYWRYIKLA